MTDAERVEEDIALPAHRNCGTMANHMRLLEMYPGFRSNLFALEEATAKYRSTGLKIGDVPLATIKVVVNVVYHAAEQNISDAQINSQIAALNKDFRATNTDKSKTPPVFKGLISDPKIQFKLDHITRTSTTKTSFSDDNGVKKASTGGVAAVDTTKFLNIWTCALGGGLLGYAQFPGGPSATDGVVIHYLAFGTNGTAKPPYNKGRSATHEIGHFFNLHHIWGDTANCSGTDMVADTPNAAGAEFRQADVSCRDMQQRTERRHVHELHGLRGRRQHVHVHGATSSAHARDARRSSAIIVVADAGNAPSNDTHALTGKRWVHVDGDDSEQGAIYHNADGNIAPTRRPKGVSRVRGRWYGEEACDRRRRSRTMRWRPLPGRRMLRTCRFALCRLTRAVRRSIAWWNRVRTGSWCIAVRS